MLELLYTALFLGMLILGSLVLDYYNRVKTLNGKWFESNLDQTKTSHLEIDISGEGKLYSNLILREKDNTLKKASLQTSPLKVFNRQKILHFDVFINNDFIGKFSVEMLNTATLRVYQIEGSKLIQIFGLVNSEYIKQT